MECAEWSKWWWNMQRERKVSWNNSGYWVKTEESYEAGKKRNETGHETNNEERVNRKEEEFPECSTPSSDGEGGDEDVNVDGIIRLPALEVPVELDPDGILAKDKEFVIKLNALKELDGSILWRKFTCVREMAH